MPGISPVARKVAQRAFMLGDRLNVHVLPVHYYTPVASRKQLRQMEAQWRRRLDPLPFAWDVDDQVGWLRNQVGSHGAEVPLADLYGGEREFRYGPIEGQFLHSWVRTNAPARIVEIGSGTSTEVMSRAVERNVAEGRPATQITACDPYTADWVSGLAHVSARKVGGLELGEEILSLEAGDLLFIDSTHVVRTGSELARIYLELLPRLKEGVIVHIHDIYLPYIFAPDIYTSMFDWQETTLVAALLAGNKDFEIRTSFSGLFHDRPAALREIFPEFRPAAIINGVATEPITVEGSDHFPSSLWLERVR